jgi:hypothetical protein
MLRSRVGLVLVVGLSFAALAASSCGGGGGGDQAAKFVGAWTFASGALTPMCPVPGLQPLDLTGGPVVFEKVDDATLSATFNATCNITFRASGNTAMAAPGQSCTLDLGAPLGPQTIQITTWTLTLAGDRINCTIAGSGSVCTAMGTGVLARDVTAPAAAP